MWPFKAKEIIKPNDHRRDDEIVLPMPMEKSFDWAHYQAISHGGIHAGYQDEYDLQPTIRVLKSLYAKEQWVSFCINAVARQFMSSKLILKMKTSSDGDEQNITQHPLLYFLSKAGNENPSFFTSNNIIDMLLTGNAYVWISQDLTDKKRIPAERVDLKFTNGVLSEYHITNSENEFGSVSKLTVLPNEMIHFMMPNPYSPYVGMSLLMAINLPVLIDKYSREYIIGFFLRGGHTSGIIQTDATNADALTRMVKSIMATIGGRRNAHADKVLPKGATWAASGAKFSDIQLSEILKDNQTAFRAATGTTNTVLGIAENVNRATAMAEMEHFWKMTILPLQYIYCAAIKHSSLWKRFGLDDRYELCFDNSKVEYLDDFDRKLDADAKLAPTATINERRERLGFAIIERLADKFEVEMKPAPTQQPLSFSLNQDSLETKEIEQPIVDEMLEIKSELPKLQSPTTRAENYFQREFARWEDITLANLSDLKKAREIISKRSEKFAKGLSEILLSEMMKVYAFHLKRFEKKKSFINMKAESKKDKLDSLLERGKRILEGKAYKRSEEGFVGYSKSNMERIHEKIEEQLAEGKNFDDVASYVRLKFGDFYEGQATTIVRTEFSCAMAEATQQFGKDLSTVAKKTTKTWITMGDNFVRDSHIELDGVEISGDADKVPDEYFISGGSPYLRYPKDENGQPEDVINCRCDLVWDVDDWGE